MALACCVYLEQSPAGEVCTQADRERPFFLPDFIPWQGEAPMLLLGTLHPVLRQAMGDGLGTVDPQVAVADAVWVRRGVEGGRGQGGRLQADLISRKSLWLMSQEPALCEAGTCGGAAWPRGGTDRREA